MDAAAFVNIAGNLPYPLAENVGVGNSASVSLSWGTPLSAVSRNFT